MDTITITEEVQGPAPKQMGILRSLAMDRGESFAYPRTAEEATKEIERLEGRRPSSAAEQAVERRQVSRDMAERGGASAVRDEEIVGYGSSAHWAGNE